MNRLRLAIQFLTIVPLSSRGAEQERDLPASMSFYPAVGAVIGLFSAFLYWISVRHVAVLAAAALSIVFMIWMSGALHLDGFADTCDGFGSGRDAARSLEIMKDSHSGAMAVIGVACLLILKTAFLAGLEPRQALAALVVAPTLGRWSMVLLCAYSRYARQEFGTASAFVGHVQKGTVGAATLSAVVIAGLLLRRRAVPLLLSSCILIWLFKKYSDRRIGGITGDILGALSESLECFVFAALSIRW